MTAIEPRSSTVKSKLPTGPLGFGKFMTDRIAICRYADGLGWGNPEIVPYKSLPLDPCALALHYGQAIYEGVKAYRGRDGQVALFRPRMNAARFRLSAKRMAMAEMPDNLFVQVISQLVAAQLEWVPDGPESSLYLRPVMIADEAAFGVRRSSTYLFFVVATPVDSVYLEGGKPFRLQVTEDFSRAAPGGGGDAKTAGNYGRTLLALGEARAAGFDNVLWLDPMRREFIEEAGITNVFIRFGARILTPPLNGRILAGVTRDTVIQLAQTWGFSIEEREISVIDLLRSIDKNIADEIFLTGTATHVAPVGSITFRGVEHITQGTLRDNSITRRLSKAISDIQRGLAPDNYGWMHVVNV